MTKKKTVVDSLKSIKELQEYDALLLETVTGIKSIMEDILEMMRTERHVSKEMQKEIDRIKRDMKKIGTGKLAPKRTK